MNRINLTALIILIAALSLGGCRKTSPSSQTNSGSSTTSILPVAGTNLQPAGGNAPTGQSKYFKGSIGNNLGLQMKLVRDGEQITGNYFYQKAGARIQLKGAIDKTGNLTLDEYDAGGKQSGSFKGIWRTNTEEGLDSIAGNWAKPGSDKKTAFSLHEEPIDLTGGAEIVGKSIKDTNKKLNYKIEVGYPEITAPLDNRFSKFNQEAKALVTKNVTGFKKEISDAASEAAAETEPSATAELTNELTGDYTVALANDSLLSVRFDISVFTGGAHGTSSSSVLNYDVKAGKLLKLADVFKPGAKYVPLLSSYCIKDLKKQSSSNGNILPDETIQEGAGPSARNFDSWTISKKGLLITFDAYLVGPYAAGPQYVLIPYSALKDLLNPDGPLKGVMPL